ncbi:MAG: zinc-ribbon domain-containing protein [Alphaproteobacteria bacterium]|nr:zinc-ribbon domain-containing protein [Alphaproteobacteria bacterium]
MILECPSCQNRYLVDQRALGVKGRTVRCAKCKNQWFAEPPVEDIDDDVLKVEEAIEQEIPPIPEGSSVPAITKPRGVPLSLKLATGGLAVLTVLVALVFFQNVMLHSLPLVKNLYSSAGVFETDGIVFAGLEYEKKRPEGSTTSLKDEHVFKGYLVNTTAEDRKLPHTLITLLGKDDALLKRQPMIEHVTLAPGESKFFDITLSTSPEALRHVVIEHGSPYELKLR